MAQKLISEIFFMRQKHLEKRGMTMTYISIACLNILNVTDNPGPSMAVTVLLQENVKLIFFYVSWLKNLCVQYFQGDERL